MCQSGEVEGGGMDKIKVLIADNSPIFALGLRQALSGHDRIEVIDHVYDGQQVIDKTEELKPDIILMDLQLPRHDGIKVTEMLHEIHPEVKVIILASPEKTEAIFESAIRAGAKGFLLRTVNPMELAKGIVETVDGGAAICPTLIPLILGKLAARREKPVVGLLLSAREKEVMEQVAEGKSNRDIAETLFISENTVKGHLRRIIDKLKVTNRVEVARYVMLNELLERETEFSNGEALERHYNSNNRQI